MTLALTIADNQDGTGLATISGSSGGSTNTLYVAAFTGAHQPYTMATVSSITSDGTIALSTQGIGFYLWQVVSVLAGVTTISPPVLQNLTDATKTSVISRCLSAYVTRINTLNLPGIASTHVFRKWLPRIWEKVEKLPCVIVCPIGGEIDEGGLAGKDDIGYPVVIVIADTGQQNSLAKMDMFTLWRQKIARAFRWQRLPGVTEIINTYLTYDNTFDPSGFSKNYLVSVLSSRPISREIRGLT